jgi:4'-phosphopantetheinyl transferase
VLRRQGLPQPVAFIASGHAAPHLPPRTAPLHALPEREFRAELRRLNGTPAAVLDNVELMAVVMPTLRADFAVSESYTPAPEPSLNCPVLALGGMHDPRAGRADLEAWRQYTRGPFQVRILPGDHFFLQSHRAAVLNAVARFLDSRRSAGPSTPEAGWHAAATVPPLTEGTVHVWRASLDRGGDEVRALAALLSPAELARAERFHFRIDRQRYLVGRGLLRTLLGDYTARRPADLCLWYNSLGKPALADESGRDGLKFNVSHSEGQLLVAVACGREVGIDVEHVRAMDDWRALADRFFAPAEVAALDGLAPADRERAFFACWTRKEAYVKARGLGLSLPLDQFAVSVAPGEPARLVSSDYDPSQVGRWELRDVSPDEDYAAAVATEGSGWDLWCGICPW